MLQGLFQNIVSQFRVFKKKRNVNEILWISRDSSFLFFFLSFFFICRGSYINRHFFQLKRIYGYHEISFFIINPNFFVYFIFFSFFIFIFIFVFIWIALSYIPNFFAILSYGSVYFIYFLFVFFCYIFFWVIFFIDCDLSYTFNFKFNTAVEVFEISRRTTSNSINNFNSIWEFSLYFFQYMGYIFDCFTFLFMFFFIFFFYFNSQAWSYIYSKKLYRKKCIGNVYRGLLVLFFFYFFSGESFRYDLCCFFSIFSFFEFFFIRYKFFIFIKFWNPSLRFNLFFIFLRRFFISFIYHIFVWLLWYCIILFHFIGEVFFYW